MTTKPIIESYRQFQITAKLKQEADVLYGQKKSYRTDNTERLPEVEDAELNAGIKAEMKSEKDPEVAKAKALDNIKRDPKYYTGKGK